MAKIITYEELKSNMGENCYIIDIRTSYEFASYHLPGAVNIPYDLLMTYPEHYLKRDESYFLICEHGSVSMRAATILESYGYVATSIRGGYEEQHARLYSY